MKRPPSNDPPPRPSPFDALKGKLGDLPPGPSPVADSQASESSRTGSESGALRLRRERAGRRGKTVVLLEGPGVEALDLASFARRVAKALGTGATVEGQTIVVRGDVQQRLAAWLATQGFSDVRLAN